MIRPVIGWDRAGNDEAPGGAGPSGGLFVLFVRGGAGEIRAPAVPCRGRGRSVAGVRPPVGEPHRVEGGEPGQRRLRVLETPEAPRILTSQSVPNGRSAAPQGQTSCDLRRVPSHQFQVKEISYNVAVRVGSVVVRVTRYFR